MGKKRRNAISFLVVAVVGLGTCARDTDRAAAESSKVKALAANLQDPDPIVRWQAAQELMDLREKARAALEALLAALDDEDYRVLWRAIHAVCNLGADARAKAIPSFIRMLKHSDNDVHRLGMGALYDCGELAVPALTRAVADEQPQVRMHSAEVLGRLGSKAASAVPALQRLLQDDDAAVRDAARGALARIGGPTHDAPAAE